MGITKCFDIVMLSDKEIQDALAEYVSSRYHRTLHGRFRIEGVADHDGSFEYVAKACLENE